jgi:hypothetical protein
MTSQKKKKKKKGLVDSRDVAMFRNGSARQPTLQTRRYATGGFVCRKKKRRKVSARRVSVGLFAPLRLPHPSSGNGGPDRAAMTAGSSQRKSWRSPVVQRATIRGLSAGLWTCDDVACMRISSTILVVVVTPQSIARVVDSGVSRTLLIQAAILCAWSKQRAHAANMCAGQSKQEGAPVESATCWRRRLSHAFTPDSPTDGHTLPARPSQAALRPLI